MLGLRDRPPTQHIHLSSPLFGVSVGIGTAAVLATTTVHTLQRSSTGPTDSHTLTAQIPLPTRLPVQTSATSAAQLSPTPTETAPVLPLLTQKSAFEKARDFGWQAALKGQNPQDTSKQWGEAALLWQQAIYFLDQVSPLDDSYSEAQEKRAVYRVNLQQVISRQLSALTAEARSRQVATTATNPASQAQTSQPQPLQINPSSGSTDPAASATVEKDWIVIAKKQGWQAALAGQNAPHPADKWAAVSRLWQTALQTLEKIEPQSPQYAQAQAIRAQYQKNLDDIRKRYQVEQAADQRLRSLQATLYEIENSSAVLNNKRTQLTAIVTRLRTIPLGTMAHARAQALITTTTAKLGQLPNQQPDESSPRIATAGEPNSNAETQ